MSETGTPIVIKVEPAEKKPPFIIAYGDDELVIPHVDDVPTRIFRDFTEWGNLIVKAESVRQKDGKGSDSLDNAAGRMTLLIFEIVGEKLIQNEEGRKLWDTLPKEAATTVIGAVSEQWGKQAAEHEKKVLADLKKQAGRKSKKA